MSRAIAETSAISSTTTRSSTSSSKPLCKRRATRVRPSYGSFDVLIARTGHRTNDIMKVLTLTSVILLPDALIAGAMGMNFKAASSNRPGCSPSSSR
jgi:Mg2+ and Co2+ transporter CorA